MTTITMYRIKKNNVAGHPNKFRVSQAYRIMTEVPIQVPREFMLQGVSMHENYIEWFESTVMPILEKHNGDNIMDSWAVPSYKDPEHVTISICINDTLVAPDILYNTTSIVDSPKAHRHIVDSIQQAIAESDNKSIVVPPQDQKWVLMEEVQFVARLMQQMMQVP